jgi:glycerol-3-phosphate dehydrogenase
MFDAIIVGAGVIGAAVAYELSRYGGKFLVLEKEEDLCAGTTKANSGIAHGGYDAVPGTMKAKMNMAGIRMMEEMSKTLDFPYHKIGTLVLCHDEPRWLIWKSF